MARASSRTIWTLRHIARVQVKFLLILGAIALVVAVVAVSAAAGGFFDNLQGQRQLVPHGGTVVAVVGDEMITANDFEVEFQKHILNMGYAPSFDEIVSQRRKTFDQLVSDSFYRQSLRKLHIRVSRRTAQRYARESAAQMIEQIRLDVFNELMNSSGNQGKPDSPEMQKAVNQGTQAQLVAYMKQEGVEGIDTITENAFAHWYINQILFNKNKQYNEFSLLCNKRLLGEMLIKRSGLQPIDEKFVKRMIFKEVKARMIFVPVMGNTAKDITAAKKQAFALRQRLVKDPSSFAREAMVMSAHATARDGGDLGWVKAGWGQVPTIMMEYLILTVRPGEISPVALTVNKEINTPMLGYTIVMVEGERNSADMPKSFSWSKSRTLAMLNSRERYEGGLAQEYILERQAMQGAQCKSPELRYLDEEIKGRYAQADASLKQAVSDVKWPMTQMAHAAYAYQLAGKIDHPKERIPLLETILPYSGKQASDYHIELAQLYLELKQSEKAKAQLRYAEIMADDDSTTTRLSLVNIYDQMGDQRSVARLKKWIDDYLKIPTEIRMMRNRDEE